MTFSIVARDAQTGMFGIAVTTKFFGVGSLCPFAQAASGLAPSTALSALLADSARYRAVYDIVREVHEHDLEHLYQARKLRDQVSRLR